MKHNPNHINSSSITNENTVPFMRSPFKMVFLLCLVTLYQACATNGQHNAVLNQPHQFANETRPFSDRIAAVPNHHFGSGTLPLGIGAKFDVIVSDAASQVQDVYQSVIKPIRRGKILSNTPLSMDYSLFPSSGEAFEHDGGMDTKSIKSKYKVQVGMSRNMDSLSNLFDVDFWLANGRYNPAHKKPVPQKVDQTPIFSENAEDSIFIDFDAENPSSDIEPFLGTGWNISEGK